MIAPKTAVIRIVSLKKDTQFLFQKKIAGLSVFKRLILSLQKTGIVKFIVLAQGISATDKHWVKSDILSDFRFKSNIHWNNLSKENLKGELSLIRLALGNERILFVEGNLVTTAGLIKDFITTTPELLIKEIAGLVSESGYSDGIYFLHPSDISHYLDFGTFKKPIVPINLPGPWFYRQRVKDSQSVNLAEKNLLNEHKLHYSQAMDVWVNSLLSIKISSFLAKTPLTPNQITLFGLIIGAGSGILFAQGNYWDSFLGGLLLILTAIWDCCDGDIARLKFMESDFGDKLDTICDNIISVFAFTGIMFGVAHFQGLFQAMAPFLLLVLGGSSIFYLIYFPRGGKGSFFKNTPIYSFIQTLASRNFIYLIFLFSVVDKLGWFLWLAGIGSNIFALSLYITKRKIRYFNSQTG